MGRTLRRILFTILTLVVLSFVVFALMEGSMGSSSSVILSEEASSEMVEDYKEMRGASLSFIVRYLRFLGGLFTFNFGYTASGIDITSIIMNTLPITLYLSLVSVTLSTLFSIVFALFGAKRKSIASFSLSAFSVLIMSLPSFLISLLMVLIFSLWTGLFPAAGYISPEISFIGFLRTLFLPSLVLSLMHSALMTRIYRRVFRTKLMTPRADMLSSEGAKGIRLVWLSSFRESLPEIASVTAESMAASLSGSAIVESVFAVPGIGCMIVNSAFGRDKSLTASLLMVVAFLSALSYIIGEIVSYLADPRLRRRHAS